MVIMQSAVENGRTNTISDEHLDVIVIGGGQAGLAMGSYLAKQGQRFLILDAGKRVGDVWRNRWDSLRLFTPARYDGLPGLRFPKAPHSFPTREEMADYLEAYVEHWSLPVRTSTRVDGVWPAGDGQAGYVVTAGNERFIADQVVIATGIQAGPYMPEIAKALDPDIRQLHSSDYRNPAQLQDGAVLVVGAGNSGAEIAIEVASKHRSTLAGTHPGEIPLRVDGWPARIALRGIWFSWNHLLTQRTSKGRTVARMIRSGHSGPLVRVTLSDLEAAGVERVFSRVSGARDGKPMLDDGRMIDVANILWCTGFRSNFGWIHLPVFDDEGHPRQERGVVSSVPGVYFVGLPFQRAFTSMLVGGVGRDAAYIARRIQEHSLKRIAR